ncbi:MAG: CHASE2 domain-containing protein, partial [Acidobacteria bacterium]|nr:CHASE2 domain-containing protein [Acidobacteriota bacterium]
MKKPRVVIPDPLLGGLLTAILLLLFLFRFGPTETIESKLYDLRSLLRPAAPAGQKVAIVEIDERSVAELGRYPWPRSVMADGLDVLSESGAKVIGLDILYPDPEQNQGLDALQMIRDIVAESSEPLTGRDLTSPPEAGGTPTPAQAPNNPRTTAFMGILNAIDQLTQQLDSDSRMTDSLALSQNVVLPVYFEIGEPMGRPEEELSEKIVQDFLTQVENPDNVQGAGAVLQAIRIIPPIEKFVEQTRSLGHINIQADPDGVLRSHILLVDYDGQYFPSFATQIAKVYLNLQSSDIRVRLGGGFQLGNIAIPTDPQFKMLVSYN